MSQPLGASRYVAMGSSFAAGPGLRPRVKGSPRLAGRSHANYAHLVAARLGLDLDDQTYSGASRRSPRPVPLTGPSSASGQTWKRCAPRSGAGATRSSSSPTT